MKGNNDMKKILMILMAVALIALPTMAQQQEWRSTSAMQTSGSTYSPQVTAVGAAAVGSMATTTETYSPAKAPGRGLRKDGESSSDPWGHNEEGGEGSDDSPIGDAMLPLMVFAAVFCGVIMLRRKRATLNQ
jgi:hypothetical protein